MIMQHYRGRLIRAADLRRMTRDDVVKWLKGFTVKKRNRAGGNQRGFEGREKL